MSSESAFSNFRPTQEMLWLTAEIDEVKGERRGLRQIMSERMKVVEYLSQQGQNELYC